MQILAKLTKFYFVNEFFEHGKKTLLTSLTMTILNLFFGALCLPYATIPTSVFLWKQMPGYILMRTYSAFVM